MMIDDTSTANPHFSDQGNSEHNVPIYKVAEISQALKLTIEHTFRRVRVRGEISGFKRAASGHQYFSLKDEGAVLDGVCWRGTAARIRMQPEDGMELIVTGRLTTYPARSRYQIVAESFEFAGEGALLKLLDDRRRKLAAEGLFDVERKHEVPFLPNVIGIITSPTGSVVRDILHRLADRFPSQVLVWPVLVQGEEAARQVAGAIEGFNAMEVDGSLPRPDLLIVARGGGSIEDIWAFNEEVVVRAVAESFIPLISAIGHETDTTLIDFVADVRAPTPTAAAEMAVPVRHELLVQVLDHNTRLTRSISRLLDDRKRYLQSLMRAVPDLPRLISENAQRLDEWSERLGNSLEKGLFARRGGLAVQSSRLRPPSHMISHCRQQLLESGRSLNRSIIDKVKMHVVRFENVKALLESYSYERVLDRGFALVTDTKAKTVASVQQVGKGEKIDIRLKDGSLGAEITLVSRGPRTRVKDGHEEPR